MVEPESSEEAPTDLADDCGNDVPDTVLRKRKESRAAEAASWKSGGNVVDEAGVLCNLDALAIPELKDRLRSHPEYDPSNRGGAPRDRLKAVLRRKEAERNGGATEAELETKIAQMSAKAYVAHLCRDATELVDAYHQGFQDKQLMQALERMNRDVAVIKMGNAVKYLVTGVDHTGRSDYRFLKAQDFHQLYANTLVPGEAVSAAGLGRPKPHGYPLSKLWDTWNGRRELEGIGFFPGSPKHPENVPNGYLNMWSGLGVTPKSGDWSLFRNHLRDKVCGGDKAHFEYLYDWLAHAVQRPQEKPGSAVVLKSRQKGSGKSMLLKFLRPIFGRHLYSAAKIDQLTGRFNGHLEETVIFGVEEGFWAGNHAANSALKDLITGEHIAVERKGLDSKNVPNFTRFIFLSNEGWVVPVGTDERRYFVLEFEHDRAKDPTYFGPVFEQMERNGGIEAMLYDLMERKITSDLRNPPTTVGLLKQREQTLDGSDRFLLELAREGGIAEINLKSNGVTVVGKPVVWETARQFTDKFEGRALQTSLGGKLTEVGVQTREERFGEHRRSFVFPSLPIFRTNVAKHLGIPIDDGMNVQEYDAAERVWKPASELPAHVIALDRQRMKRAVTRGRAT